MPEHLRRGAAAEQTAQEYLTGQGLKILATNFRTRLGEIDIIAEDGESTVFVEVRYRRQGGFGGAAASVLGAKQRRLIHSAQLYLQQHPRRQTRPARFDVIAITGEPGQLEWIPNAFGID